MDQRLEEAGRTAGDFAADYVEDVLTAVRGFTDTLLRNVATLTRGVVEEGGKIVVAACDAFLPDDAR